MNDVPSAKPINQLHPDTAHISFLLRLSDEWSKKDELKSNAYAMQALQEAQISKSFSHTAKCYQKLASNCRSKRTGQLYLYDSLFVSYSLLTPDSALLFNALQLYVTDLLNINKTSEALPLISKADAIAETLQVQSFIGTIEQLKGFYYYKKINMKEAASCFRKSLAIARTLADESDVAKNKIMIASSSFFSSNQDSVLKLIFEAIEYYSRKNTAYDLALSYNTLASAYQMYGNLTKAIEYYSLSKDLYNQSKEYVDAANAGLSISRLYLAKKNYDTATVYIQNAENLFNNLQYIQGIALVKNHWGQLYSAKGNTELASRFFHESSELNKKIASEQLQLINDGYAAVNMAKAHEPAKADSLLVKATEQMKKTVPQEVLLKALNILKTNEPSLIAGDYKETIDFIHGLAPGNFHFDTAALSLNPYTGTQSKYDSSINALYNHQLLELETKYKIKVLNDNLYIEKQNQLITHQLLNYKNQQLLVKNVVLTCAALVLILLCIIARQQTGKRKQAEIARLKAEEEKIRAETDRTTIARLKQDSVHRIENNLQIVSSFLLFAKDKHRSEKGLAEVEERLDAVMVLQKTLDKNIDAAAVDMEEYLKAISGHLVHIYSSDNNINLLVTAPVNLEADSAQKIGLIVNELVTNSLKYAFIKQDEGQIFINMFTDETGICHLHVQDNGIGLPSTPKASTGMDLIEGFCHQLKAPFCFSGNDGTAFHMSFSASRINTIYE